MFRLFFYPKLICLVFSLFFLAQTQALPIRVDNASDEVGFFCEEEMAAVPGEDPVIAAVDCNNLRSAINYINSNPGDYEISFNTNDDVVLTLASLTLDNSGFEVHIDGGTARVKLRQEGINQALFILNNGNLSIQNIIFEQSLQGNGNNNICLLVSETADTTSMDLQNTRFEQCRHREDGAGLSINNEALVSLNVNDSSFYHNQADSEGNGQGNGGAIFVNRATNISINNSTFAYNQAFSGGALYIKTLLDGDSSHRIHNSTFSQNHAQGKGGAIATPFASIRHSTFYLNSSDTDAYNIFKTFNLNRSISIQNSLLGSAGENNQTSSEACDRESEGLGGGGGITNYFVSDGYNLGADNSCQLTAQGDQEKVLIDGFGLAPLNDNGGPTQTHALLGHSLALDGGTNSEFPSPDQRGEARPTDGNGDGEAISDIGSFEAGTASCGDGIIQIPAGEECDDGSQNGSLESGCNLLCLSLDPNGPQCGNGTVELDEICDEGEANGSAGATCSQDCQSTDPFAGGSGGCSLGGSSPQSWLLVFSLLSLLGFRLKQKT